MPARVGSKPLDLMLSAPLPSHLRVYLYSLVAGGKSRSNELKAVLRVPGQQRGAYGAFDDSDGYLVLLAGYSENLDVFVLWDSLLHPRFKNGGNVQVREDVVIDAASSGWVEQRRRLKSGVTEVIFACRSDYLHRGLQARVVWSGGE